MYHISWPSIALVSAIGTHPSAARVVQSYFYLHPAFLYSNTLSSLSVQNPGNFHLLNLLGFPYATSCRVHVHLSLGKMLLSSALVWEAAFQPVPAKLCSENWPVQPCLCLCWSSPGSDWSCKWNTCQAAKLWPICSHVDLQIFPPEFEIFGTPGFLDMLTSFLCRGGLGCVAQNVLCVID